MHCKCVSFMNYIGSLAAITFSLCVKCFFEGSAMIAESDRKCGEFAGIYDIATFK